jgi:hypothetical protein
MVKQIGQVSIDQANGFEIERLNKATTHFLMTIQVILKSKGFVRTSAARRSATYEWRFERKSDGRTISIDGWHGTGRLGTNRFWGFGKTFFSLYDNKSFKDEQHKPVFDFTGYADSSKKTVKDLIDDQIKICEKALDYIKNI